MALFQQLLNVKMDRGDACKGLGSPLRGCLEGTGDPEAHSPLHLLEVVKGACHVGLFVHPEPAPIGSYGKHTGLVKHPFMFGPEPAHGIAKGKHGIH